MSKLEKAPRPRKPFLQRVPFSWFPFTLLRSMILFFIDLYRMGRRSVERSIRLQLVLTFAICLGASTIVYAFSSAIFGQINKGTHIDYSMGVERIDADARELVRLLEPVSNKPPVPGNVQDNADPSGAATGSAQRRQQGLFEGHTVASVPAIPQQQRRQQAEEGKQRQFNETVNRLTANEKYKILITDLE
ncbi:hypothetical protein O9H85_34740 [Paenibacillus filicis]|uniref:ABC transporter permease n=1 Tax=Paenibacillus gyeongsangnamensis TaxID=3388067 RepID=A0ABT4QKP5_9BACL|nr:hypothetical protein [Paenibacillus filicis]MCZ8517415.1 hypothetical protein [Paenibacillus filicis]